MHTISFEQTIGQTPLVELTRIGQDVPARLFAKLESRNPGGSVKDRAALFMLQDALDQGKLEPGSVIVEPTSGNTGIALAMLAARMGIEIILTMPESMSLERRKLLAAYGAKLVLTPAAEGMPGAIAAVATVRSQHPKVFVPMQFDNPANPLAHEMTTGPEIWTDSQGQVDAFVAGVGTGGTVSGVGRALKARKPEVLICAVEPAESPVLSGGQKGPHAIQGIGAGFVPSNYDANVVDAVLTVTGQEAMACARRLWTEEGMSAGISSGANLAAALALAAKPEMAGKHIVFIVCDTGERYLSSALFA